MTPPKPGLREAVLRIPAAEVTATPSPGTLVTATLLPEVIVKKEPGDDKKEETVTSLY